jgi:hypothetical protein
VCTHLLNINSCQIEVVMIVITAFITGETTLSQQEVQCAHINASIKINNTKAEVWGGEYEASQANSLIYGCEVGSHSMKQVCFLPLRYESFLQVLRSIVLKYEQYQNASVEPPQRIETHLTQIIPQQFPDKKVNILEILGSEFVDSLS